LAVLGRFFEAFDLRRALRFGLVPLVWQAAYASLYLQQEVRAWIAYRGGKDSLSYWRTRAGREVDFVVYSPDTFGWGTRRR
jgi:hypothetical protein